ncbi:MAG: energy transducer TonB [Rikenellaceae bacterium]
MKRLLLSTLLPLIVLNGFAVTSFTSQKQILKWLDTTILFPKRAYDDRLTDVVHFSIHYDLSTGVITDIDFEEEYYHLFTDPIRETLLSSDAPRINFKRESSGVIKLSFDYFKLIPVERRDSYPYNNFINIQSIIYPTYMGDSSGQRWIYDIVNPSNLIELYGCGADTLTVSVKLTNAGKVVHTKVRYNNKVVDTYPLDAIHLKPWSPFVINGERRAASMYTFDVAISGALAEDELQLANQIRSSGGDIESYATQIASFDRSAERISRPATEPLFNGGGLDTFRSWVLRNIRYPNLAQHSFVEDNIVISFDVDTDGSLVDIKVLEGENKVLINEVLRVVSQSPKWSPLGEKITVTLPFSFMNRTK